MFLLSIAVISAVTADVSHLIDGSVDGYHYEPPVKKLCPDGTVKEICDVPTPRCPTGQIGVYPNCNNEYLPPQECPVGTTGVYPNCKAPQCPPGMCL